MQRGVGRPGGEHSPGTNVAPTRRERPVSSSRRMRGTGPADINLLPLLEAERSRYQREGALTLDVEGQECLRGLTRPESVEYLELARRGLDNDDAAFLRYILLGDRHAAATVKAHR